MQMKQVCAASGLTKKAVEYYEEQGLITPQTLENGYRDYTDRELATLREISLLRRCGLGLSQIRTVLSSADKSSALARFRHLNRLEVKRLRAAQSCLDGLIENYDIEHGRAQLEASDDGLLTLQEKLLLAFPGRFGLYVSLHFGRFLSHPAETPEQQAAFNRIIEYLDRVPTELPPALEQYLEQALQLPPNVSTEQTEQGVFDLFRQFSQDPDTLAEQFDLEQYITLRTSEEFKQSPAGQFTEMMRHFQQQSGYHEIFLESLKQLSPSYRQYCAQLEELNDSLLKKYPQLKALDPSSQPTQGE